MKNNNKINLTECSEVELELTVSNDEKLYSLRFNFNELMIKINDTYIYNNEQLMHLIEHYEVFGLCRKGGA